MGTAGEPLPQTASYFPSDVETGERDDGLSPFVLVRPRLFGIAYRMLGSAADAEDIVQDVWLRWQATNRAAVERPFAFLAKTTTRLCINLAQSAHSRHETHTGTWRTEPAESHGDPELAAERGEALRHAVRLLLERLSPAERGAYVLREAFDYSYRQIAGVLHLAEANARQLVSRARKQIGGRRCSVVRSGEQRLLQQAFITAAREGDMATLEALLADDVLPPPERAGVVQIMNCDLCNLPHTTGNLLCDTCADLVHRTRVINDRMNTREACVAERPAAKEYTDASKADSPELCSWAEAHSFVTTVPGLSQR